MDSKEIYSIIKSSKVNIPTTPIYFEKNYFLSITFTGRTFTQFHAKLVQTLTPDHSSVKYYITFYT